MALTMVIKKASQQGHEEPGDRAMLEAVSSPASPHYSRGFVTKPARRHASDPLHGRNATGTPMRSLGTDTFSRVFAWCPGPNRERPGPRCSCIATGRTTVAVEAFVGNAG
jgi:hypothetical protein